SRYISNVPDVWEVLDHSKISRYGQHVPLKLPLKLDCPWILPDHYQQVLALASPCYFHRQLPRRLPRWIPGQLAAQLPSPWFPKREYLIRAMQTVAVDQHQCALRGGPQPLPRACTRARNLGSHT